MDCSSEEPPKAAQAYPPHPQPVDWRRPPTGDRSTPTFRRRKNVDKPQEETIKNQVPRDRVARDRAKTKGAGALFTIGALQWFLCVLIAEGLHPGFTLPKNQWIPYSNQIHYVSELGVGSTALIFNISTIVLGLMIICGAVLLFLERRAKFLTACLVLAGIGAIGVGVFSTEVQPTHGVFQAFALILGALAAILSFRRADVPLAYVSVLLGAISLACTIAFFPYLRLGTNDISTFIGLGKVVMERLVIYPIILWLAGYGYLLIHASPAAKPKALPREERGATGSGSN